MKTKILIVAMAAMFAGMVSCKKDKNEVTPSEYAISVSNTSRMVTGLPVEFTFSQAPAGSTVHWSVSPFNNVQINAAGRSATILFNDPGSYTINANYGQISGSTKVSIHDSIINPGGGSEPTYVPLTGDQIFITVSKVDSMGLSGLDFRSVTWKKYDCLNHTLMFDNDFSGQDLQIHFNSVMIPPSDYCEPGEDYATAGTSWYPVAEGTHGFEVILDGQTYTGSFIKAGNTYTFTWPYTSGVTLTPLILN